MGSNRDSVGFHLGPEPLEVDGTHSQHLNVNSPHSSHQQVAQVSQEETPGGGGGANELLNFLDSLTTPSLTTNSDVSDSPSYDQQSVTGPSSISLSVQSPLPLENPHQLSSLFPETSSSSSSSLGFLFDDHVLVDNNINESQKDLQVKPPSLSSLSSSTFSTNVKGFDAGDISMPFDLSLPLFDPIAYPVFTPHQQQSFKTSSSSSTTVPLGSGVDPIALDSTLDSPLASSSSHSTSPWSELLASPMFSLPNSGNVAETPLPPLDSSTLSFDTSNPLFPPLLPEIPTSLPYESLSTTLRPLPPLPVRPSQVPSSGSVLPTPPALSRSVSTSTSVTSEASSKPSPRKPEPTGFRTTIPLLGPDAPIQTRNPIIASSTSRKRKTAGAEKALAKKRARQGSTPALAPDEGGTSTGGELVDPNELPPDILEQVERKRLQNTMSARKSRARKLGKMLELEEENKRLGEENRRLREQLEGLLKRSEAV